LERLFDLLSLVSPRATVWQKERVALATEPDGLALRFDDESRILAERFGVIERRALRFLLFVCILPVNRKRLYSNRSVRNGLFFAGAYP